MGGRAEERAASAAKTGALGAAQVPAADERVSAAPGAGEARARVSAPGEAPDAGVDETLPVTQLKELAPSEERRLNVLAACCAEAARAVEGLRGADEARTTALLALGASGEEAAGTGGDAAPTVALTAGEQDVAEARVPGGTKRFPTGVVRARNRAADEVMAEEARKEEEAARRRARRKRVRLALIACIAGAAACAAGVFAVTQLAGIMQQQTVSEADVRRTLEADPDVMSGFAENDYVEALPYELVSANVADEREDDGVQALTVDAVIANGRFESSFTAELAFVRLGEIADHPEFSSVPTTEGALEGDWVGRVVSVDGVATEAVAGVDFDEEVNGGAPFSPSFDRTHQTCTYTERTSDELWFGTVEEARTLSYRFDGTRWARYDAADAVDSVRYTGLEGAYQPDDSAAQAFDVMRIDDVDPDKGTFTLVYEKHATGLLGDDAVSGEIPCTLARADATPSYADYAQEDGCVYTFSGTGTSSGGNGTATVEGVLGTDYTLHIDLAADYTRKPFLFGSETPDTLEVSASFVK